MAVRRLAAQVEAKIDHGRPHIESSDRLVMRSYGDLTGSWPFRSSASDTHQMLGLTASAPDRPAASRWRVRGVHQPRSVSGGDNKVAGELSGSLGLVDAAAGRADERSQPRPRALQ